MKKIRTLKGHQGWVGSLTFAADGRSLFSTSLADVTARVWDWQTGTELRHIGPDKRTPIFKLLACPDGKTLVSYGQESSLRFWDAATGKERACPKGRNSWIGLVSFSANGRLLGHRLGGGTHSIVGPVSRKEVHRFTHSDWLIGLPFSPNGKLLASACMLDPVVRIWAAADGKEVRQITTPCMFITCLAWSGDGKTLATWSRMDRIIHIWDAETGKERPLWGRLRSGSIP